MAGPGQIWPEPTYLTKLIPSPDGETRLLRICFRGPYEAKQRLLSLGWTDTGESCAPEHPTGNQAKDPDCDACNQNIPHVHVDQLDVGLEQP